MKKKNSKSRKNNGIGWGYDTNEWANSPMQGVFDQMGGVGPGSQSSLSSYNELAYNASYYFISMNRVLCTYSYTTYGVFRTLVDQPVYDAFRGGLTFKSDELDEEDIDELNEYLKKQKILRAVVDALRWDRLFGGGGLLLNTDEDYSKPFKKERINPDRKLSFIPADRWELVLQGLPQGVDLGMPSYNVKMPTFNYYGRTIDPSRVIRVIGEEAPSLARRRLQGWGMSVIECVLREINQYLKHQNVLFELMDEAKIDVYRIKDFNSLMLTQFAKGAVVNRITLANRIKNFCNAIILDSEDEYQQKQLSLSGFGDFLEQIRISIAAATRFPVAKLFGLSSTGFASGEDAIENYNSLVEHERERAGQILDEVLPIVSRHLFGDDFEISYEWKPLRILGAVDEENVINAKFNRHSTLWSQGFYTSEEYARALKEDRIVLQDTEVSQGTREMEPPADPNASWQNPQQIQTPKKVTEVAK